MVKRFRYEILKKRLGAGFDLSLLFFITLLIVLLLNMVTVKFAFITQLTPFLVFGLPFTFLFGMIYYNKKYVIKASSVLRLASMFIIVFYLSFSITLVIRNSI